MSALPEDPGHFVAWRGDRARGEHRRRYAFAPRRQFGALPRRDARRRAGRGAGERRARHHRTRAATGSAAPPRRRWAVVRRDGQLLDADAVVVATGLPPAGTTGPPELLATPPFFVPDPWAPGALDVVRRDASGPATVLLVGTGLTMVDVDAEPRAPRRANRPDRSVHAVSRSGRLPRTHAGRPGSPPSPTIGDWGRHPGRSCATQVAEHLADVEQRDRRLAAGRRRAAVPARRRCGAGSTRPTRGGSSPRTPAAGTCCGTGWRPSSGAVLGELCATTAGSTSAPARSRPPSRCPEAACGSRLPTAPAATSAGWSTAPGRDSDVRDARRPAARRPAPLPRRWRLATVATAGMGFRTDARPARRRSTARARRRSGRWARCGAASCGSPPRSPRSAPRPARSRRPSSTRSRRCRAGSRTAAVVGGHHPVARPRDPLGPAALDDGRGGGRRTTRGWSA